MLKNNPSIALKTICDCIDRIFDSNATIFFSHQDISKIKITITIGKNCDNNKLFPTLLLMLPERIPL